MQNLSTQNGGTVRARLMAAALICALVLAGVPFSTAVAAAPNKVQSVSVTAGPTPASVTYGTLGTSTYTVHVVPTGGTGRDLTANLSVPTALPTGVTWSFAPASLYFAAGDRVAQDSTLTIHSTGSTNCATITPAGATSGIMVVAATVTSTVGTTFTVDPLALTVSSASVTNREYDGTAAATLTGSLVGRVCSDAVTLNGTGTFASPDAGTHNVTSTSTLAGAKAANYTLTQPTGLAGTILPRTITVTAVAASKTYNGDNTSSGVPTLTAGTLIGSPVTNWTQTYDNKNAGANKTLTPAGTIDDGNNGHNYDVTFQPVTTGEILTRSLLITATGVNKTYDGSSGASVTLSDDRVGGDVFTATYTSATFADAGVATGKPISVTGISITGDDAGNYTYNSTATASANIDKATSTVTVSCPASETYTGSAIEPCTAEATGVGMGPITLTVNYSSNTNVGTAGAAASWAGDTNHTGNSDSKTFQITQASSSVAVTCPASETYTGSAIEPCTAEATGDGMSPVSLAVNYSDNTIVGTAGASAAWDGDVNHGGNNGSATFGITPAPSTVSLTCPASETYTGSAIEPCTAEATGAGLSESIDLTSSILYSSNTGVGPASADVGWSGDDNHSGDTDSATFDITPASSSTTVTVANTTYDGTPQSASASVAGVGGLNETLTVTYEGRNTTVYSPSTIAPTDAGDYTASASFDGDTDHVGSSDSQDFTIGKAAASITTHGFDGSYDGSAHVATGTASGVESPTPADLTDLLHFTGGFTDVPGGTAYWSFDGNNNYLEDSGEADITIHQATPALTVTNSGVAYSGLEHTATVSAGTVTGDVTQVYYDGLTTVPVDANTYMITADFTPTDTVNFETLVGASAGTFEIGKTDATCEVSGYSLLWDGTAHTATGACTGAQGETLEGLDLSGTTHTDAGTFDDEWTFTDVTGNYHDQSGHVQDQLTATIDAPTITDTDPASVSMSVNGNPTPFSLTLHATDPNVVVTLGWEISSLHAASHGTADIGPVSSCTAATGQCSQAVVTYEPASNYIGSDTFDVVVSDGTNSDTITVNVQVGTEMLKVYSAGSQDGWVLESGPTTSTGGSLNYKSLTFMVGDNAAKKQYRSILSFNTTLPAGAVITQVQLRMQQSGALKGKPFPKLGSLLVYAKNGYLGKPTLEKGDFKAAPTSKSPLMTLIKPATPVSGTWYSGTAGALANTLINKSGTTQFRIQFTKGDNGNTLADYVKFFSGNAPAASQPELTIYYYLP